MIENATIISAFLIVVDIFDQSRQVDKAKTDCWRIMKNGQIELEKNII